MKNNAATAPPPHPRSHAPVARSSRHHPCPAARCRPSSSNRHLRWSTTPLGIPLSPPSPPYPVMVNPHSYTPMNSCSFRCLRYGSVSPMARLAFSSAASRGIAGSGLTGGDVGRSGEEGERRRWWTMCAGSGKE
jgi:hypothetical protein